MKTTPIQYYDSVSGQIRSELVYGAAGVRFLYGTRLGGWIERLVARNGWFSSLYGWFQNLPSSRRKILPFIGSMGIESALFLEPPGGYPHFNAFFIREFRPGVRPFDSRSEILSAPAEARYLGWDQVQPGQTFPVKGRDLSSRALLGKSALGQKWSSHFEGGPVLIARLCPVDYHRYHYPVSGEVLAAWEVRGSYHSVNPWALARLGSVFSENVRRIEILRTQEFGHLALIEVGATGVGRIVQTHSGSSAHRGDQKGYFLFGASTVIVLGEPGAFSPIELILKNTRENREVWIPLGQAVAQKR